jgi:putative MATE family efflux protein
MKDFVAKLKCGDHFKDIVLYWVPEVITAAILVTLPPIIDSYVVASSQSIMAYGALGMATNFLHFLIKLAEAIPVASIAIMGRYNGNQEYEKCGRYLGDTFWITTFIGFIQFILILIWAKYIYIWLGVPPEMAVLGAPLLRLKSFGVFLVFTAMSFIGFMRAVKNTRVPMLLFLTGIFTFIFFDIALVWGKFGFPQLNLMGSAIATVTQYTIINILAIGYILFNPDYKKYFTKIFLSVFSISRVLQILNLSWPIMIDKSTVAIAYIWLSKMLAKLGTNAIATYDVVKNLERSAFVPVMAAASVVTFLVSNRLGAKDPTGASASIKKTLFLTTITVVPSLIFVCLHSRYLVSFFDPANKFTEFAASTLPIISLLVMFDATQVILAGALRGAGDVRIVMWGRLFAFTLFFVPASYLFACMPLPSETIKFILVYGSFYITTGILSIMFLIRIKSHKWENKQISSD